MQFGQILKVWGDYALFSRPEMKVERVTYEVMTPSAACGILSAIYWKPAIKWEIDRIHVINEIKFDNIKRNEVGSKMSFKKAEKAQDKHDVSDFYINASADRQQRASLVLKDVCYVIEAHFEMTGVEDDVKNTGKHAETFRSRAAKGQCFHMPYFGCREFGVNFELIDRNQIPESFYKGEEIDLGLMLYGMDFTKNEKGIKDYSSVPRFFKAVMKDGIVNTKRSEVLI